MAVEKTGATKLNFLRSKAISDPYMVKYIQEGWETKKAGKGKICWATAAIPISLLYAFDIPLFFPEFEAIAVGVMGEAVKWQLICEKAGYSRDLCSYARVTMGRILADAGEAEGANPPPDFLVTSRMNCNTYIHWWEMLARHFKVPLFVFDGPFWDRPRSEPIPRHFEEYWIKRMYDLIAFLEEQTGKRFDHDRYMENIGYELEAHKLLDEITRYSQRVPSPVGDFDIFSAMLSVAWWRGTKIPLGICKEVKAELGERVDKGITAIPNEKHRLMLMSNPPWFRVEMLPDWMAEVDAIFVSSLLNRMVVDWSDVGGGSFEEVLRSMTKHILNYNIADRVKWSEELVRDWKCDAMAFMDNRGCKIMAFPAPEMMADLVERVKLPCFRFEGNMNDPRDFNDQAVRSQFEGFMELLEQH